jgi:hypothetical protein
MVALMDNFCSHGQKGSPYAELRTVPHSSFVCSFPGCAIQPTLLDVQVVKLVDLLDEARDRCAASIAERHRAGEKTDAAADAAAAAAMGYGAVKYADLKNSRLTNYKFSMDDMLNMKGNTAVYLLYAHARIAGIVRKSEKDVAELVKTGTIELVQPQEVWNTELCTRAQLWLSCRHRCSRVAVMLCMKDDGVYCALFKHFLRSVTMPGIWERTDQTNQLFLFARSSLTTALLSIIVSVKPGCTRTQHDDLPNHVAPVLSTSSKYWEGTLRTLKLMSSVIHTSSCARCSSYHYLVARPLCK